MMRDCPNDEGMAEIFAEDPGYAVALLNEILKDGGQGEILIVRVRAA